MLAVNDCLNRTSLCGLIPINGAVLQHISGRNEVIRFNLITVIVGIVPGSYMVIFEVGVHFLNTAAVFVISDTLRQVLVYMSILMSRIGWGAFS